MTLATTTKRERKFKTAKQRPVDRSVLNLYDSDQVVARAADFAYKAVSDMFPWLSFQQIRTPPRQYFDAKLARQVAIYALVNVLNIPQRQVARLQNRQRTSIHFALRAVEKRLEEPRFANEYEEMTVRLVQRCREEFRRSG